MNHPHHPHQLFFSRNDATDPRLGDLVANVARPGAKPEDCEVILVGYPDDEGIELNRGRVGAAKAPEEIRRWLYRMTPHARRPLKTFFDSGDLAVNDKRSSLLERHEQARHITAATLKAGRQALSLGGGNDYAYADGMAFLEFAGERALIINVDAHFDVRDMSHGPSSGTPFFRLLESGVNFDFVELGIQSQCNSRAHWDFVERKGGHILSLEDFLASGESLVEFAIRKLGNTLESKRPTFLAIDIDAFAWPYAIGSSASWPLGLDLQAFWPLFKHFLKHLDVRVLGIYEVSPPLDVSSGTSKLAAQLAHEYLHYV